MLRWLRPRSKLSGMQGFLRETWQLVNALSVAFFPASCANCHTFLATRVAENLCRTCLVVLEPNLGPRCDRCDVPLGLSGLCSRCAMQSPSFALLRAPFIYGGPLTELITSAKFSGREDYARALGHLLLSEPDVRLLAGLAAFCVPMPLSQKRIRSRGYNQSAVLAHMLAHRFHLPYLNVLRRVRDTAPQSDLSLEERQRNVASAFVSKRKLEGTILLIDDVVTSGATMHHAAQALLDAGADKVLAIAVARAAFQNF